MFGLFRKDTEEDYVPPPESGTMEMDIPPVEESFDIKEEIRKAKIKLARANAKKRKMLAGADLMAFVGRNPLWSATLGDIAYYETLIAELEKIE